jgi:hypothetical protein
VQLQMAIDGLDRSLGVAASPAQRDLESQPIDQCAQGEGRFGEIRFASWLPFDLSNEFGQECQPATPDSGRRVLHAWDPKRPPDSNGSASRTTPRSALTGSACAATDAMRSPAAWCEARSAAINMSSRDLEIVVEQPGRAGGGFGDLPHGHPLEPSGLNCPLSRRGY